MANISSLFQLGRSALTSHQARLGTIQNNIANASTPGYARQRVDLVTVGGSLNEPNLRGVSGVGPNSVRTPFFDRQLPVQRAAFGYSSTRAQIEGAVEAAIYPVDGPNLGSRIDSFFGAARDLSANPSGDVERRSFVQEASALANRFNSDRATLVAEQESVRNAAFDAVDEVNGRLEQIAELDKNIEIGSKAGTPVGELVDQRNRLIAEVAEQVEVRVIPGDDQTVQVTTLGGRALMEGGRARALTLEDNGSSLEMRLSGAAGDSVVNNVGGAIGGMMDSHNGGLQQQIDDLDQMAEAFATRANAVHSAGFDKNGAAGGPLFSFTAGSAGATIAVDANVAADPSLVAAAGSAANAPGGNGAMEALVGVQDEALVGTNTLEESFSEMRETFGRGVRSATNDAESASAALAQLENLEAAVSGVSLEEEMIALTEAQRAFDAAIKVVQTTDEMMETVMSLKR
jgi:flagellar hook-associated protein 1 FlgK